MKNSCVIQMLRIVEGPSQTRLEQKVIRIEIKECRQYYLMAPDSNDPCGWNYKSSVGSYWTSLLDLLKHEARHLVVVLKRDIQ